MPVQHPDSLLFSYREANITIDFVVADAPKRCELGCYEPPQAYYGCGLCPMKAKAYKYKTVSGKDHTKTAWTCTDLPPLRDPDDIRMVAHYLDRLSRDERRGITGLSPLFRIPGFNPVQQLVPEYMHFLCIGVVKLMCELSIKTNKTARPSKSNTKVEVKRLNARLKNIKGPSEFSRKIRPFNPADWKAEEYRNFILFYVFTFIDTIPASDPELLALWNYLAFLVRAYCLPDKEYEHLPINKLKKLQTRFVTKFRQHFGEYSCTYNLHQILHMDHIRKLGSFPKTSAFPSECCFAKLRRSFAGGTPNPIKQILTGMYQRFSLGHSCKKRITVANYITKCVDDSLFYTFHAGQYKFYKTTATSPAGVRCQKLITLIDENELQMQQVGVQRKYCLADDEETIPWRKISGKAIAVGSYIISIPNDALRETSSQG